MGERLARRDVLVLGVGALVVAAVPLAMSRSRRIVRRRIPVMGTIAEVAVVVSGDESRAQAAIDAAFAELRRIESAMTSHDDASEIGRANLAAARDGVAVSAETALVVEEAVRWSEATGGAFDPCLGAAMRLWDVQHRLEPPADEAVRRLAQRGLWQKLDVGSFGGVPALRFQDADVRVDLGGIAKGWAVDRAAQVLREHGFADGLVNVGGDLVALGRSATGDPWKVGVQSPDAAMAGMSADPVNAANSAAGRSSFAGPLSSSGAFGLSDPDDPASIVATIEASDTAIATSGDYVRFFEYRGRRYHHLLDPSTGAPRATPVHSLTIQAPTCFAADAAATAVYGAPAAATARILATRAPGARVVHSA